MPHINPIQIQKFLKGVDYPASKAALIENAKNMGADENVCDSLEQLPDEDFQTPADVSQAIGHMSSDTGMPRSQSSAQSSKQSSSQSPASTGGNEFIAQALQDSLVEVELCELALQKTSNEDIKMFAQRMIDEHSQIGRDIEQLARKKQFDLPKDASADDDAKMEELAGLSDQDFDRKFIEHNVRNHQKDIKIFQHYAQQETDAEIKAFAEKGEKMLSQHLNMAKDIGKRLQS